MFLTQSVSDAGATRHECEITFVTWRDKGGWLVSTVGIPRRDQTNIFQPQVPRSGLGSQPFSLGHVPVCSFSMSGNATDQDLGFGHAQSHCRKSFNILADSQDGLTMVPISGQNENSACDG
jgi:hypothetical protein